MRKKFGKIVFIGLMVALASNIVGCGGKDTAQEKSVNNTTKVITLKDLENVQPAKEIIFWSTDKTSFKKVSDEFEQKTGIKVVGTYMGGYDDMVNKVMAGIRSKNLPDVAQLGQRHGLSQMYDSKALLPIEKFVSKELVGDILPEFWKRFTYKNEKLILPFQNSMPVVYYNKTLFENAGVKPPTTFEELQKTAEIIKKQTGVSGFSTDKDTPWYINALVYNNKGNLVSNDNKSTFNTKEVADVFKAYADMSAKGVMPKAQHNTAVEDFSNGQIGMVMASCASYKKITSLVGDKFEVGVAMFPKTATMDIPMGGNGLGVFNTTPEKVKAAVMFVEFMLDKDRVAANTLNSGYIPVTRAALKTEAYQKYLTDPNRAIVHEQLQYLGGRSVNPADSTIWNEIQKIVEKVEVESNVNLEKILKEADEKVQNYLKGYKG